MPEIMIMDKPIPSIPRFIVGMPRASTTWLCRSINEHKDITGFGETMFWGKAFIPPNAEGYYDEESLHRVKDSLLAKPFESTLAFPGPGGMRHIGRKDLPGILDQAFQDCNDRPTPAEIFLKVALAIAAAEGKKHWVEKTPHHLLYTHRILQHLTSALFVVVIREPYSFMLSYKHQKGHENSSASRQRFTSRYHPLGCALVWRNSWLAAQKLSKERPEQTLFVRMEDVEENSTEVMRKVQQFFLLPEDPGVYGVPSKVNSAFADGSRPELTDADIAWMNLIAGKAITDAGYPKLPRPKFSYSLYRSLFDLPAWSLRWLRDMRRTTEDSVLQHLWRWLARNRHNLQ
jgi:hypothetical protein